VDNEKFARLEELDRKVTMIDHIAAILEYDQETAAKDKAFAERSKQMGWVKEQEFLLVSGKEMGALLTALGADDGNEEGDGENDFEKALIRNRYRQYARAVKIPAEFVLRKEMVTSDAYRNWIKARESGNDADFLESLKAVVDCIRQEASYVKRPDQLLYDALLDTYEPDMTTQDIDGLFSAMEKDLLRLVATYKDVEVPISFLYGPYEEKLQEKFALSVISAMGFDFSRGQLAYAPHPFTTTLGEDDIRITTRYSDPSVMDPLCSTIHEAGHALYEMGASSGRLKGTSLGCGGSMGLHESQSRFWENIVLKSPDFWKYWYSSFKAIFPSQVAGINGNDFVKAINLVKPSFIRVNADEVSYGLHIIMRYRLEKALVEGSLEVRDLPDAWNCECSRLLGLTVQKPQDGYLQDVHWASGLFGYFPSYALGNLYGIQIYDVMKQQLGISAGNPLDPEMLGRISNWLCAKVYGYGSMYTPMQLLKKVTGKALDASMYTQYLEEKLSSVYGR
jgi:carboxypeptidase Taq